MDSAVTASLTLCRQHGYSSLERKLHLKHCRQLLEVTSALSYCPNEGTSVKGHEWPLISVQIEPKHAAEHTVPVTHSKPSGLASTSNMLPKLASHHGFTTTSLLVS